MNIQTTYTFMRYFEYSVNSLRYEKSCLISQEKQNKMNLNQLFMVFYLVWTQYANIQKLEVFNNSFSLDRSTMLIDLVYFL